MPSSRPKLSQSLANLCCKGSVRKLIQGWWYSIIVLSFLLIIMSFITLSTRGSAEGFTSAWATIILIGICVGGTMIMRKFHDAFFVGLFLGCLVAGSQFFLMLYLLFKSYAKERTIKGGSNKGEQVQSFFCLLQSILLGSFAIVLGTHRDDIVESKDKVYDPPSLLNA